MPDGRNSFIKNSLSIANVNTAARQHDTPLTPAAQNHHPIALHRQLLNPVHNVEFEGHCSIQPLCTMTSDLALETRAGRIIQLSNYFIVASSSLLVYDFLLTLNDEVQSIWTSRWTCVKIVYLLSRYLPFADMCVILYQQFTLGITESECRIAYKINGWIYIFGMALSEIVLTYRVWVLWERNTKLAYGLAMFFCALWGTGLAVMNQFVTSLTFLQLLSPLNRGCVIQNASRIVWADWALLLLYNTGTLILMVRKATLSWSDVDSRLFKRLYRVGLSYYLFLFVISVGNVAVIYSLPIFYVNLLSSTLRVLHSVLSNRVFFDIRKEVEKSVERQSFL